MNIGELFLILDGLVFLAAALLMGAWLVDRSYPVLRRWSAGYVVAGVGLSTVPFASTGTSWIYFGLGSSMVLAAYGIMWNALRRMRQPPAMAWGAALPPLAFLVASGVPPLQGNEVLRMVGFGPLAAIAMAGMGYECARLPGPRVARYPLIGIFTLHGGFYLVRSVLLWVQPARIGFWQYTTVAEGLAFVLCDAFLVMSFVRLLREAALSETAQTDFLTGVLNRRGFLVAAEEQLRRVGARGGSCFLLMFDIDHFKRVNDRLGHAAGDELLRLFSQACLQNLRATDSVGRLGGDEFAVLLTARDAEEATATGQRIGQAFRRAVQGQAWDASGLWIGASFGVCGSDGLALPEMMAQADQGLYAAKAHRPAA